jgi:large subunit ribosomal protein L22
MEARAILRNIPTSPRKMRLVADMIRGQQVSKALSILKFQPQSASKDLYKVLLSAVANWQQQNDEVSLEDASLYVKTVTVDEGRMLKRLRPAPQGRAHRVRKRSNHITLVVDDASDFGYAPTEGTEAEEVSSES